VVFVALALLGRDGHRKHVAHYIIEFQRNAWQILVVNSTTL